MKNLRHYEIVLLIHPGQSEQVPAMLERYQGMVAAGDGTVHRSEDWGRRPLAYLIDDIHKAHYVMLNIECNLEVLRDLEKNFKFNDSIVRSLIIRRKHALTEQSAMAKEKLKEDRVDAKKLASNLASADDKKPQAKADLKSVPESPKEEVLATQPASPPAKDPPAEADLKSVPESPKEEVLATLPANPPVKDPPAKDPPAEADLKSVPESSKEEVLATQPANPPDTKSEVSPEALEEK